MFCKLKHCQPFMSASISGTMGNRTKGKLWSEPEWSGLEHHSSQSWFTCLLPPLHPPPTLMKDMWWSRNAIVCQICLGIEGGAAGIWLLLCGWTGRSSATDDGLIQSQRADHRKPIHCICGGRPASPSEPGSVRVSVRDPCCCKFNRTPHQRGSLCLFVDDCDDDRPAQKHFTL